MGWAGRDGKSIVKPIGMTEWWNIGFLKFNISSHHTIIPVFQYSS